MILCGAAVNAILERMQPAGRGLDPPVPGGCHED